METPETLEELEAQLKELSHDDHPLRIIQQFTEKLRKTAHRQEVFNAKNALVREPIVYQDALERGLIGVDEDPFTLLQGDIISTDTAYLCGERLEGMNFAIASSTCDLVPKRRKYAALLRLEPIKSNNSNVKSLLSNLLKFTSTKQMYLPPLPSDSDEVIANAIIFDGIVQVSLEDLLLATRYASLSLVGWRIFGSLVRTIMVRAGESEVKMRTGL